MEVKCLELRLELEDKEYAQQLVFLLPSTDCLAVSMDEELIEKEVDALREKLLASLVSDVRRSVKSLKVSDTHAIAAAKKVELERMARAFGTKLDYSEGDAFDREKQDELKQKRILEREERDRKRDEERARFEAQKKQWKKRKGRRIG